MYNSPRIRVGIERGEFEPRDPDLAAAAVIGMVITPAILFHSARVPSLQMCDLLSKEMLVASMGYLRRAAE